MMAQSLKRIVIFLILSLIFITCWWFGTYQVIGETPINGNFDSTIITTKDNITVSILKRKDSMFCYGESSKVKKLKDNEVKIGKSVFFLLTSCSDTGEVKINSRQVCAIESAALAHPEKDIFLLLFAPVTVSMEETNNPMLQTLTNMSNIRIRHVDYLRYLEGTPMSGLTAQLARSLYPMEHASDIIRYTTLYKYKGTYIDLDVMILKQLPEIDNYVGAESVYSLGAGIVNFGDDDVGTDMASQCAEEIRKTFSGQDWGNNGPGVITRVIYKRCHDDSMRHLWGKTCDGFKIHPPNIFYPLPFSKFKLFFEKGRTEEIVKKTNESYLIHYWNKKTAHLPASKPGVPFYDFAKKYCPGVFKAVDGKF